MVGLPGGVLVERPGEGGPFPTRRDGRPCPALLLPVNRYGDGGVARFGGGVRVLGLILSERGGPDIKAEAGVRMY